MHRGRAAGHATQPREPFKGIRLGRRRRLWRRCASAAGPHGDGGWSGVTGVFDVFDVFFVFFGFGFLLLLLVDWMSSPHSRK